MSAALPFEVVTRLSMNRLQRFFHRDPRVFQIAFLAILLVYVLWTGPFTLSPLSMFAAAVAAFTTQGLFIWILGIPKPGWLSPTASTLSLCILLRTGSPWVAAAAGVLTIGSKFLLRARGKHIFNPSNFGILVTVLLTNAAWVSPAQWGSGAVIAFMLAALGLTVVGKIGRLDITFAFLGAHALLQLGRVLYLGELPEVALHRLATGTLIVFAFFMISDPRPTPDARGARVLFASLVAVVAYVLRFHYFIPSAPLWALLVVSPTTPLLDSLWRGTRFVWERKGAHDAQDPELSVSGLR